MVNKSDKSLEIIFLNVEFFQGKVIRHMSLEAGDDKDGLQRELEEQVVAVKGVATACDGKRSK